MPGEILVYLPLEQVQYHPILLWGLSVVKAVQNLNGPVLGWIMTAVSEIAVMIVIPLAIFTFWCINEKKGAAFAVLLVTSSWINSFLKILFKQPRPFDIDLSVALAHEPTYGFPSGHSQVSLVMALFLAIWLAKEKPGKKPVIWIGAVFYILLIGFSRVFLGVHFPTDLLGGWFIGGILIFIYAAWEKQIVKILLAAGKRGQLLITAALAFVMQVLLPSDSSLPAMLLGFGGGHALMINSTPFAALGTIDGRKPGFKVFLLRCLIGMGGAALIYFALKFIFPGSELFSGISWWGPSSPYIELGRFIRYGLLGFWVSSGAPRIFGKLNLANNRPIITDEG